MNKYISDWFTIIDQMSTDNTYKLAWGRAILECISFDQCEEYDSSKVIVNFLDISEKIVKYYWNQLFFFNLKQAPYKNKTVVIVKYVEELIVKYKSLKGNIPAWFNEGQEVLKESCLSFYNKKINDVSKTLHENVSHRFLNINSNKLKIYLYDKNKYGSNILFYKKDIKVIKEYAIVLSKLLNFKWAQLLEKYNFAPKISNKVSGLSDAKLKRSSLTKFKNELLKQFKDGKIIDFYTGEEVTLEDVSIDHVIPWSFMYSDDIWNLVITSKKYNSSKSNKVVVKESIEKLKLRNKELLSLVSDNFKDELSRAEKYGYVDKFYYDFRI